VFNSQVTGTKPLQVQIAMVVQLSSEEESKTIKQDIDLFLSVAGELSGKLAA
jgi:hypothetical protein